MFALDPVFQGGSHPPFLKRNSAFLANASSGLFLVVSHLKPRRVWVPSFVCSAVPTAIDRAGGTTAFYEVDYDLRLDLGSFVEEVGRGDLVVLIDYFGFPVSPDHAEQIRGRGARVLEDASQALLSAHTGRFDDIVLLSCRKTIGVPDGGIVTSDEDLGGLDADLETPPVEWWLNAVGASLGRRDFDVHGMDGDWFGRFRAAEAMAPIGAYRISDLSRALISHGFDYAAIAQRRRSNYLMLGADLRDIALFPDLPDDVVPLGFPVRVGNRDEVRQALFAGGIFPPVHWNIEGVVPRVFADSHRLSADIMTLPCDQRYGQTEMERIVGALRAAIRTVS